MTLNECRKELRSIISELQDIEWGVRRDFSGIGEQLCGNCIDKIADKYNNVLSRLNRVNENNLAEWAKESIKKGKEQLDDFIDDVVDYGKKLFR